MPCVYLSLIRWLKTYEILCDVLKYMPVTLHLFFGLNSIDLTLHLVLVSIMHTPDSRGLRIDPVLLCSMQACTACYDPQEATARECVGLVLAHTAS